MSSEDVAAARARNESVRVQMLRRRGVHKVRVRMHVGFFAYVVNDEETGELDEERIREEVLDAVTYRAPHLIEVEEHDALVVMEPGTVRVVLDAVDRLEMDRQPHQVDDLAVGFAGEVF